MTLPYSHPSGAEIEIRRRIAATGPLSFDEFMDVALYWPDGGYYATREAFGTIGDFYTAPLTHPAFGALATRQIEQMWQLAGAPVEWTVLEPGAGMGQLARDVIAALSGSDLGKVLRYVAVDRRSRSIDGVSWVQSSGVPFTGLHGMVLANELFDAMPVHRVTVVEGALREVRVGMDGEGRFVEVLGEPAPGIARQFADENVHLSEGHRTEVCLGLGGWFEQAASAVETGYLLLFDYGHEAADYYAGSRNRGTLRTYYQHTLGMDPHAHVGKQDISVHVDFTALRRAAAQAGWAEAGSTTQAAFLRNLGWDKMRADVAGRRDIPAQVRIANLRAMDTLVAPEGMGGFRAMAFSKGVPSEGLWGFHGGALACSRPTPLATPSHMPFAGPSQAYEVEFPSWDDLLR